MFVPPERQEPGEHSRWWPHGGMASVASISVFVWFEFWRLAAGYTVIIWRARWAEFFLLAVPCEAACVVLFSSVCAQRERRGNVFGCFQSVGRNIAQK